MALSAKSIYQQVIHTIHNIKEELDENNIVSDEVQRVKKEYLTKGSPKQKSKFAIAQYNKNNPFDAKLISFYKRIIKGSNKNLGDQIFEDSGFVIIVTSFIKNHFKGEEITEEHFPRLKEDIKQALVKEQVCAFLEKKLELVVPEEAPKIIGVPVKESTARRTYTIKQQTLALYFLLHEVLHVSAVNKVDVAKLLHLLAGKSFTQNEKGNPSARGSAYYKAYLEVSGKEAYSVEDLEFVIAHFEKFQDQKHFKKLLAKNGELDQQLTKAKLRNANKK